MQCPTWDIKRPCQHVLTITSSVRFLPVPPNVALCVHVACIISEPGKTQCTQCTDGVLAWLVTATELWTRSLTCRVDGFFCFLLLLLLFFFYVNCRQFLNEGQDTHMHARSHALRHTHTHTRARSLGVLPFPTSSHRHRKRSHARVLT